MKEKDLSQKLEYENNKNKKILKKTKTKQNRKINK